MRGARRFAELPLVLMRSACTDSARPSDFAPFVFLAAAALATGVLAGLALRGVLREVAALLAVLAAATREAMTRRRPFSSVMTVETDDGFTFRRVPARTVATLLPRPLSLRSRLLLVPQRRAILASDSLRFGV